ncbi:MAG: LysM peptidoglycan-binding domain-containing protein [Pseudomonadota bacterium]|nr:LysM peptidoglycan-binding domain-containing protein [Pseudomonadota bacterium]
MKPICGPVCARLAVAAAIGALVASCATPPPAPGPQATSPVAPGTAAQAPAPQPQRPAQPELTPQQARAQAQTKVMEAVDQLQNGDESSARDTLEQALALDPSNELGRKLRDQIGGDPEKELGTTFFRYTVQPGDSLSKLAQQYLGDRFRFHILARYNDIPNPSRLAAGQVIRIPGRPPLAAATPRPRAAPADPVARPAPTEPVAARPGPEVEIAPQQNDVRTLVQRGTELQKGGDLEGAYAAYSEAVRRDSGNREAATGRETVRQALIRRYEREAVQAFQRQNLDMAIARWNNVLDLDPSNQKARLERERASDLKKRMVEKFGG